MAANYPAAPHPWMGAGGIRGVLAEPHQKMRVGPHIRHDVLGDEQRLA
jgi:hypothetical protein